MTFKTRRQFETLARAARRTGLNTRTLRRRIAAGILSPTGTGRASSGSTGRRRPPDGPHTDGRVTSTASVHRRVRSSALSTRRSEGFLGERHRWSSTAMTYSDATYDWIKVAALIDDACASLCNSHGEDDPLVRWIWRLGPRSSLNRPCLTSTSAMPGNSPRRRRPSRSLASR